LFKVELAGTVFRFVYVVFVPIHLQFEAQVIPWAFVR
jgi:hypothetical protein